LNENDYPYQVSDGQLFLSLPWVGNGCHQLTILASSTAYPIAVEFGHQQIIPTDVDFPSAVFGSDLDGDGDLDVLRVEMAALVLHRMRLAL